MRVVLMMLAVPLARLRPRQGRFGKIGIAVLAYFFYSQLLVAARTWIEGGCCRSSSGYGGCMRLRCVVAIVVAGAPSNPPGRARPVATSLEA